MIDHTEFAAFVKRQVGRGGVQNIVMQVQSRDARIDYAAAAGLASAQAATPMTVDTPYFIASISKMYTAAMVMQLYEQGALDLDQPLSSILPVSMLEGIHRYQGQDYSMIRTACWTPSSARILSPNAAARCRISLSITALVMAWVRCSAVMRFRGMGRGPTPSS